MPNPNGNPANLRPWKPGQSGNPRGRPKGHTLTAILREILDSEEIGGVAIPDGKDVARVFVESVLTHAMKTGNPALVKEIFDRIDGKVPKATLTVENGQATPRIYIPDDDPRFTDDEVEDGAPAG